jgi:predicted enzyme related to lactoylglutathione lyase
MGRVVHFEIHASDPDRAERFYRRVFAWEISRSEGAPVDYRLITIGAGGEQVVDRQELENVGSFAYFKDTEGNIFGAMQSAR